MSWAMHGIPDIFLDSDTGKPHEACLVCHCDLTDGRTYVTEKAFRRYADGHTVEVFGYALCMGCVEQMHESLSDHSKRNIQGYMEKNGGFNGVRNFGSDDEKQWMRCTVNGTLAEEEDEYMVCAMIGQGRLQTGIFPYMLGGRAMDSIMDLMSDHTLGFLDDFTGKHFTGPPEFSEWLKARPVFV
jgi:hypothetical protein